MADSAGKTVMVQGRIVWVAGDLFQGKIKTDMRTRQPILDQQGNQIKEYGFGLAVPKSVLQQTGQGQPGELWAVMHQEAMSLYPSGQIPPGFAMKYKDGDGVDEQGRPFSQRAGYAGCLVFACTTRIPIKFFRFENGQNILVNDGIKCGDYVNVQLHVKAHGAIGQGKAGMYLNPNAVQFLGYGEPIVNAPSGDQIFGTQAPPMMGSATPLAPQGQGLLVPTGAVPAMPMQPAPQPYGSAMQPPQAMAPQPQQPHYGVLPQQYQPQMPPTTVQQPAPQQPAVMPGMPGVPGLQQR